MRYNTMMIIRLSIYIILLGLIVYISYTAARSIVLLRKDATLLTASTKFPATYTLGDPGDSPIHYLALGDSTSVGVGADTLDQSLVGRIAQILADQHHLVSVTNLGQSGARVSDVVNKQLPGLAAFKPDVITVSVGANDATHFTGAADYSIRMGQIVDALTKANAKTAIIVSAPDMHNIPALPVWAGFFVGRQTHSENTILAGLVQNTAIKIANIYDDGKLDFAKDPTLYASDLFHPSSKGYGLWASVVEKQL